VNYQTTASPAELTSVPTFEQRVLAAVLLDAGALDEARRIITPAHFIGRDKVM